MFSKTEIIDGIRTANGPNTHLSPLLDKLNDGELRMLTKNPDLIARIVTISEMDNSELMDVLDKEFELDVALTTQSGDLWADSSRIEERRPEWSKTEYLGQYITSLEFVAWAQEFLLQEVRINLWVRWIRENKDKCKQEALEDYAWGAFIG